MRVKHQKKVAPRRFELPACFDIGSRKCQKLELPRRMAAYSQGAPALDVFYIERGSIKLCAIAASGKEAIVGLRGDGDFFGEGCLDSQTVRMATATAVVPTTVYRIPKSEMMRMLHEQEQFADYFINHMLWRNSRVEEDLVDQLFNSTEKRLARALLRLAGYGKDHAPGGLPRLSQESLAEMIGSTRPRVNYFMNKFRKLGYIEYSGRRLKVNSSLLSVVLDD